MKLGDVILPPGLLADRPAPGIEGRIYFATDTELVYRDDGAAWDTYTGGGSTVTVTTAQFTAAPNAAFSPPSGGVYGKITLDNEIEDIGNHYDPALYRWTPPAGIVILTAAVHWSNLDGDIHNIAIYKNGVASGFANVIRAENTAWNDGQFLSMSDIANGTDYYEFFATKWSGGGVMDTLSRFRGTALSIGVS